MSDTVVVTQTIQKVVVSAPGPQGASGAGGGVSDGDKGDVTVSGSGSTWTIDAGAVTYAKIQATSASRRLIGRPEATAGTVSEVSLGTGLKFDGSSLVVATTDVVSTGTQVIAGTGMTGGGALTGNVTVGVDFAASGAATSGKAVSATDSRLSDARTPTTHKSSHATGGTDPLTPADIGAAATSDLADYALVGHTHGAGDIQTGTLALARGGTGANLSSTGGTGFVLKQNSAGAAVSVAALVSGDLPSHTHAASDIASGTLAVARGGTNLGTTPSNGQLLIGNGTGYTLATLTAGSNVTITNASGSITIASTGGSGGVSDGDKGDITVSSSGATWTIDADAVTYAKLQNVSATDRLLGRSSAGSGDVEEITCTAAGRAILDDVDAAAQRTTLGAAAATHTHAVGDLTAGSASSGQVLTYNGTAWAPATPSAGGTKTYAVFTPLDAQPPATNFATLDTRNSIAVLEFDGGTTDESTTFVGVIPEGAVLTSGLKVEITWMADTATSGNVRWGVQFERMNTNLGSDSFDTSAVTEGNSAANGTSGIPSVLELTCTAIDSIAAGDTFRIKVYREASDTTNDTMSGDAQLISVEVRSAA